MLETAVGRKPPTGVKPDPLTGPFPSAFSEKGRLSLEKACPLAWVSFSFAGNEPSFLPLSSRPASFLWKAKGIDSHCLKEPAERLYMPNIQIIMHKKKGYWSG